jgi:hypothetical protein
MKLTDQDLNEYMAEKVMEWHKSKLVGGWDCWIDNRTGEYECDYIVWHPCADLNQAFQCVENANISIYICFYSGHKENKWEISDKGCGQIHFTDNPARAICEAIYEAMEAK